MWVWNGPRPAPTRLLNTLDTAGTHVTGLAHHGEVAGRLTFTSVLSGTSRGSARLPCSESHSRTRCQTCLPSSVCNRPPPCPPGLRGMVAIPESAPAELGRRRRCRGQRALSKGPACDLLLAQKALAAGCSRSQGTRAAAGSGSRCGLTSGSCLHICCCVWKLPVLLEVLEEGRKRQEVSAESPTPAEHPV